MARAGRSNWWMQVESAAHVQHRKLGEEAEVAVVVQCPATAHHLAVHLERKRWCAELVDRGAAHAMPLACYPYSGMSMKRVVELSVAAGCVHGARQKSSVVS